MPNIAILYPRAGVSLPASFTANGTWIDTATPSITVVLKDSSGNTVATGSTTVDASDTWTSEIAVSQDYTDASLTATLDGSGISNQVNNLAVG